MAKKASSAGTGSGPAKPGPLTWATLAGVLIVAVLSIGNYQQMKKLEAGTATKLNAMEGRIGQLQAQVAQAANKAAQPPPQQRRGPDPNQVYALKTDGAPVHGSPGAPVTIFEVSDFQ